MPVWLRCCWMVELVMANWNIWIELCCQATLTLGETMKNVNWWKFLLLWKILFYFVVVADDVPVELDMDHWSFALSDAQKKAMIESWLKEAKNKLWIKAIDGIKTNVLHHQRHHHRQNYTCLCHYTPVNLDTHNPSSTTKRLRNHTCQICAMRLELLVSMEECCRWFLWPLFCLLLFYLLLFFWNLNEFCWIF